MRSFLCPVLKKLRGVWGKGREERNRQGEKRDPGAQRAPE